jgi:tricorn protease
VVAGQQNLALVRASTEQRDQIGLYNIESKQLAFVTSDRYTSRSPVFSPDGKWLYFLSARNFQLANGSPWGDRNMGPVFDKRTGIYALALQPDNRFPFKPDDELSNRATSRPKATEQAAESRGKSRRQGRTEGRAKGLPAIVYAGLAERLYEVPVPRVTTAPADGRQAPVLPRRRRQRGKANLKTLAIANNGPSRKCLWPACASSTCRDRQARLLPHGGAGRATCWCGGGRQSADRHQQGQGQGG